MNTSLSPHELCEDLLKRSTCAVQVAAVLEDHWGVFSWGWNHSGPRGMGMHAEMHALSRANRSRLKGSTIYVAGRRKRNNAIVPSIPCHTCAPTLALHRIAKVIYLDKGCWKEL